MEPPPFGDGNETDASLSTVVIPASMKPPPFGDGNRGRGAGGAGTVPASMEPPPFGDGNDGAFLFRGKQDGASMEPPPFGDGNRVSFRSARRSTHCTLQWSHRLSAMETCGGGRGINRPHISLQWSHRLSAMETARLHPRVSVEKDASMEPPPFGDGNLNREAPPVNWLTWLQWSHRLSAMETRGYDSISNMSLMLQWSHRLSAMETIIAAKRNGVATNCFNGATAFRRWKPPEGRASPAPCSWLQWSHRLSAMETPRGEGKPGPLQLASMEPPPFGDGNG